MKNQIITFSLFLLFYSISAQAYPPTGETCIQHVVDNLSSQWGESTETDRVQIYFFVRPYDCTKCKVEIEFLTKKLKGTDTHLIGLLFSEVDSIIIDELYSKHFNIAYIREDTLPCLMSIHTPSVVLKYREKWRLQPLLSDPNKTLEALRTAISNIRATSDDSASLYRLFDSTLLRSQFHVSAISSVDVSPRLDMVMLTKPKNRIIVLKNNQDTCSNIDFPINDVNALLNVPSDKGAIYDYDKITSVSWVGTDTLFVTGQSTIRYHDTVRNVYVTDACLFGAYCDIEGSILDVFRIPIENARIYTPSFSFFDPDTRELLLHLHPAANSPTPIRGNDFVAAILVGGKHKYDLFLRDTTYVHYKLGYNLLQPSFTGNSDHLICTQLVGSQILMYDRENKTTSTIPLRGYFNSFKRFDDSYRNDFEFSDRRKVHNFLRKIMTKCFGVDVKGDKVLVHFVVDDTAQTGRQKILSGFQIYATESGSLLHEQIIEPKPGVTPLSIVFGDNPNSILVLSAVNGMLRRYSYTSIH